MEQEKIIKVIDEANEALDELARMSREFLKRKVAWYDKWLERKTKGDLCQKAWRHVWEAYQNDARINSETTRAIFSGKKASAKAFIDRYNNLDYVLAELDKEIEAINKEHVQA